MQIDVLDTNGKSVGKQKLEEAVFGVEPNRTALNQYVRVFMANKRQGTSKAKTRGEVSGGGKKPWAQKGTGRARQGSTRSPVWVKGGVAHGPKPRNHSLSLPAKMKRDAFVSALSIKAKNGNLKILEKLDPKKISKTKDISAILKSLKLAGGVLFVVSERNENILRSGRNIKGVEISIADNLNAFEILNADEVLFVKEALEKIQKKYKG
jgi:large subunit ribosomal protein L4